MITSKHHDAARYIFADSQGGQIITEAPMKNHEDEELMLIEALVGRTTPFSSLMGYSDLRKKY